MKATPVGTRPSWDQMAYFGKRANLEVNSLSISHYVPILLVCFWVGVVMSDWGATHDTAATYANAGLDME
jgi:hypothetical protein